MTRNFMLLCLFCLPMLLLSGCGGKTIEVPELSPVSGTVTLDDKPVAGVIVIFVPSSGTSGNGATAVTDSEGKYMLKHRGGEPGIQPGNHVVIFSKFAMPDGTPIAADVQPESVGAKQVIPKRYTNADKTKNKATVKIEGGAFDFPLKSK